MLRNERSTMEQTAPKPPTRPIRFIKDTAATSDFFGSHSRIARALAGVIRDQTDLKVIGLLGDWGSGKSTVVNLAELELGVDPSGIETHFFRYDAWLHQSD